MTEGNAGAREDRARTAIWFNKRELARVDIPVAHTLAAHNDGWRVDFGGAGRIRVVGAQGPNQNIGVVEGDYLLSNGEDFYLALATAPADEAKDERSRTKQESREAGKDGA